MIDLQVKELCKAYGWVDLGPQKNWWLISFQQEDSGKRMNVYYTKGTVQIQGKDRYGVVHYMVDSVEKFEKILEQER